MTYKTDSTKNDLRPNGEGSIISSKENMNDIISRWTLNQIGVFFRLWNSPARTGFARDNDEGRFLSGLSKLGYVKPLGKVGTKIRWQCDTSKFTLDNIELMKQIVGIPVY